MRSRIAYLAIFALMAGFVVLAAALRSQRAPIAAKSQTRQEQPSRERELPPPQAEMPKRPEAVDAKKQAAALSDATLKNLIENARMAEQRGDKVTRDAMLSGLRKSPDRSKELISSEISKANDRGAAAALQAIMEKLQ